MAGMAGTGMLLIRVTVSDWVLMRVHRFSTVLHKFTAVYHCFFTTVQNEVSCFYGSENYQINFQLINIHLKNT